MEPHAYRLVAQADRRLEDSGAKHRERHQCHEEAIGRRGAEEEEGQEEAAGG